LEGIRETLQQPTSPEGGGTVSKDLYSRERVEDLLDLFRGIAKHQRLLAESIQARAEYANIVNALKSLETAEQGAELGEKALKLITMIEQEADIRQTLWRYEAELWNRYGIKINKVEEQREAV
jgi:uncharacterized protein YjaG (DUF416 family)